MKYVLLAVFAVILSALLPASVFAAAPISVSDPYDLPLAHQSIVVSAVSRTDNPAFIEIHNQSGDPVNLAGWRVELVLAGSGAVNTESIALPLDRWLLADRYLAIGNSAKVADADVFYTVAPTLESWRLKDVRLFSPRGLAHEVTDIMDVSASSSSTWLQRRSGSSGHTGVTVSDFTAKTEATIELRGRGWYVPPSRLSGVSVIEIYPRASDCAPHDTSVLCRDYIKLFNATNTPVDLSHYRLRTDSGSSLSGNAIHLDEYGMLAPQSYLYIGARDDGDRLSLTDSGGYIWLEDAEGIERYEPTIAQYPSAGSTSKIGWSWARNDTGEWNWTSTPQPTSANIFTIPSEQVLATSSELSDCPAGKYRHPDTNRCRNIEEAIATLTACDEGEYRSPETNRCRKAASLAVATVTPCKPDQERNPATNRCRAVASGGGGTPTPCKEGYERNLETNRCRKVVAASTASMFDEPASSPGPSVWFGAAVLTAAAGYGAYEWRGELLKVLRRIVPMSK